MAEGENKRNVVEMSIYFIIFLVVIIIGAAVIFGLKASLNNCKAELEESQKYVETLKTEKASLQLRYTAAAKRLAELCASLKENKGSQSVDQIIDNLEGILPELSGEAMEVVEEAVEIPNEEVNE